jgi:hypothetical protein
LSYPKAWQLAEYGRDRIEHFGTSMLEPTYSRVYSLQTEVAAWEEQRNQQQTWINWRFTTTDARVKLHRLYPSITD